MPDVYVFPGGVVEMVDRDEKWKEIYGHGCPHQRALKLAGIRELYEEANILLTNPAFSKDVLNEWRGKVHKDSEKFMEMMDTISGVPDIDSLTPYSHWITPDMEKWRYDTYFYITSINPNDDYSSFDSIETVDLIWISPSEAIRRYERSDLQLAPPTWFSLTELAKEENIDRFIFSCQQGRDLTPILPELKLNQDSELECLLPGDHEYSKTKGSNYIRRIRGLKDSTSKYLYVYVPKSNM